MIVIHPLGGCDELHLPKYSVTHLTQSPTPSPSGIPIPVPFPSPPERLRLWKRAIPEYAPVSDDLDLKYLADEFLLAGGSIFNSSINACIVAAAADEPISMRHCIFAVARELHKMGKQINRVHFGKYYDQVKDLF